MSSKIKNPLNWALSVVLCSLGIALCTKANFGLSMIAAPPYILHRILHPLLSWYSQGTSEYLLETVLILLTGLLVKKFRPRYLLSLITAVLSGLVIDGWLWILGGNGPYQLLSVRLVTFVVGSALISLAVAFVFRTTYPPQAYELIVTEVAKTYHRDTTKVKWIFDGIMLTLAILLAAFVNRSWDGIGLGTVIVTFVNAPMIKGFGVLIDKIENR